MTVTTDSLEQIPARTTWTLLLYLTSAADGCQGGETVFYTNDRPNDKEAVPVQPENGMLLLHKHGNDCMLVSVSLSSNATLASSPLILLADVLLRRAVSWSVAIGFRFVGTAFSHTMLLRRDC